MFGSLLGLGILLGIIFCVARAAPRVAVVAGLAVLLAGVLIVPILGLMPGASTPEFGERWGFFSTMARLVLPPSGFLMMALGFYFSD